MNYFDSRMFIRPFQGRGKEKYVLRSALLRYYIALLQRAMTSITRVMFDSSIKSVRSVFEIIYGLIRGLFMIICVLK